ncbi:sigma-70 region 4 domain-containing protein [Nocardia sp. CA2R105]|uniref:sigma-70 region 4 domain-containing protein n=1 Tax=Nocardia coffeae TaxID=2873381 RepID=UPI001CA7150E|nr:sigma-70 region 4 domain-containing protein [Nocardia coffeae]MBY8861128.1 sigma-70 region 4 domain-containing protein [Nocardia coffeae]
MTDGIPAAEQFEPVEFGSRMLYLPGQTAPTHHGQPEESAASAHTVRSNNGVHHSAPSDAQAKSKTLRAWPILLLALPAFVAIWSGWVGLGQLTGFGPVRPLPGIWDQFTLNTAITLPIGMETYASYALYVWLSGRIRSDRTRGYAKYSAFGSLILGAIGQVAYHLMRAAGVTTAPWGVTVLVACLPVAVLGMGAALAHMIIREHHHATGPAANAPAVHNLSEQVHSPEPVRTVSVRELRTETYSTTGELAAPLALQPIEPTPRTALEVGGAKDRWAEIAYAVCDADPAGRRDPSKVATILRLKFEQQWSHSRIADHVELSASAVTRTLTAAREHINVLEGGQQ